MSIGAKRDHKKQLIFWVDNLGLSSLWCIWRIARMHSRYSIYYKEINHIVRFMLEHIKGRNSLRQIEYHLGDMKAPDGLSLGYKIDKDVIAIVEKAISRIYMESPLSPNLIRFPRDKTLLYLKQRLTLDINQAIFILSVADYYHRNDRYIADSKNVVISKSGDIINSFFTGREKETFTIIGYRTIANLCFQRSTLRILIDILGQIFRFPLSFVWPGRHEKRARSLPKIGMPCTQKIDLNKRSVLFWVPYSQVEFERILIYFEDPNKPVTDKAARFLNEHGVDWLLLHPRASQLGKKNMWRLPLLNVRQVFRYISDAWRITYGLLFTGGYLRLWQWHKLLELLVQTYYHETFYKHNNIQIIWNMKDNGWDPTMNAIAVELVGGISASTHWSNYETGFTLRIAKAYDVFFSWGSLNVATLKGISCFRNVVQCGYIYDYRFPEARIKSRSLRRELKDNGVIYVLGFMDGIVNRNSPLSRHALIRLYQALFNLIINNKRIGLILKPKRSKDTIGGEIRKIQPLLRKALATKRCFVIDKNNLECFSFEVGLACDLVIGFGTNTVAFENALAGVKSVIYDSTGNREIISYSGGYNKIIFDDVDFLIDSISRYLDTPAKSNGFADHSSILEKIDPFRDGKAAQRIGFYMNELLTALDDRLPKDRAIERANQKYQERYGYDKVDRFVGKEGFFK